MARGSVNDAKHPNIGKTPGGSDPLPCTITLSSEAMQGGALSDWLPPPSHEAAVSSVSATGPMASAACRLTAAQRMQIAVDAAKGLSHLHSTCKLLHGDVCSFNVGIAELDSSSGRIRAQLAFSSFTITMREFIAGDSGAAAEGLSSAAGDAAAAGGSASARSSGGGGKKPLPAAVIPTKAGVQADLRGLGTVLLQLFMGTAATADDPTVANLQMTRRSWR